MPHVHPATPHPNRPPLINPRIACHAVYTLAVYVLCVLCVCECGAAPPRIVYNAGPPKAPPRSSVLMNPGFRDSMASTNGAIYQQAENDELDGVGGLYEEPIAAPTYRDDSAPMYEASGPV